MITCPGYVGAGSPDLELAVAVEMSQVGPEGQRGRGPEG